MLSTALSPHEKIENDKKHLCKKYIEQAPVTRAQYALYDYAPDAQQSYQQQQSQPQQLQQPSHTPLLQQTQPRQPQQQVPTTKKLKTARKDTIRYAHLEKLEPCFILRVPPHKNCNKISLFIHEKACAEFLISMPKESKSSSPKEPVLSLPRKLKYHCNLVKQMTDDAHAQALWDATTEELLSSVTSTDEYSLLLLSKLWKGGEFDVHTNEKITSNIIARIVGQPVHQLYEEHEQAVALQSIDSAFNHITSGGCYTIRTSKQPGHFVIIWRTVLGVKSAVQSRVCVSQCPTTGHLRVRYCPFNIDLQMAKLHPQLVQWYMFDRFFCDALHMNDMFFTPKYEAFQHVPLQLHY